MQNGYIGRKNGSIGRELLNAYLFYSLAEVRAKCEEWRMDYNTERPHKSLGYMPPLMYAQTNMNKGALSTPANENHPKFQVQRVVDKALFENDIYLSKL
jgi:putative transposase